MGGMRKEGHEATLACTGWPSILPLAGKGKALTVNLSHERQNALCESLRLLIRTPKSVTPSILFLCMTLHLGYLGPFPTTSPEIHTYRSIHICRFQVQSQPAGCLRVDQLGVGLGPRKKYGIFDCEQTTR